MYQASREVVSRRAVRSRASRKVCTLASRTEICWRGGVSQRLQLASLVFAATPDLGIVDGQEQELKEIEVGVCRAAAGWRRQ